MKNSLFLLSFLLFLSFTSPVKAESLLKIDGQGEIILKVLSSQDSLTLGIPRREFLEVKDVAVSNADTSTRISLRKEGDSISLNVESNGSQKSLDVTNWQDDLIEIEERGEKQKVKIAISEGKFNIEQKGAIAQTEFPINIDPAKNELSVDAPSGIRFISILPIEAVESLLRARIISRLNEGQKMILSEGERGELIYEIKGEKLINLFNLLKYPIEVNSKVSALTGEIIFVDQPVWLKIFGFLFV